MCVNTDTAAGTGPQSRSEGNQAVFLTSEAQVEMNEKGFSVLSPAPAETRALQYWKSKGRSVRPALIVWGVEDGRGAG